MKIIPISGVIGWDVMGSDIRKALNEAGGEKVRFDIASPGGYVYDGLEIFNLIRDYEGETEAKIIGLAASMASYIPLACDKIIACENAVYMIHNVWGYAVGDYQEMEKTAEDFRKLSELLGKAYMKKTGKSFDEIKKMMDDETFLYGEEISEMGFAEGIESDDMKIDKQDSLASAKIQISGCVDIMKKKGSEDIQKAAALLPESAPQNNDLPAAGGENKKENREKKTMNLEEFLKENPGARAEFDTAIASARKEGRDEVESRVATASKFVSGSYPKAISDLAVSAIAGEADVSAVVAAATAYDATQEKKASDDAQNETEKAGETPADQGEGVTASGEVSSEAEVKAAADKLKQHI